MKERKELEVIGKISRLPILFLVALSGIAVTVRGETFTGPRIEATASRWTWPSRLSFVNDAMRCTFAGTNENTQLKSVDLRTSSGVFVPLIGRAGPLQERHPAAVETFTRLSDGFLMERQLPAATLQDAPGAWLRTGARLQLAGNEAYFRVEEDVRILRAGRASVESFVVDVTPSHPEVLLWQHGESVGTTNVLENVDFRAPAEAFAICGSQGIVVLSLRLSADPGHVSVQSEILVRNDRHGVRCSFIIVEDQAQASQAITPRLDVQLLPAQSTPDVIRQAMKEVRP